MVVNVLRSSCKVPVILADFNETWIFWTDLRKMLKMLKYQISRYTLYWKQSCSLRTAKRIGGPTDRPD